MSLFSGNPNKNKQIELQNIIFGTNEKKLMVSPEFLDNMTKQYISKRMKTINQKMEIIFATKSPKNFFNSYDSVMESLDELILIQKHHEFKKPIPSEFKKSIEAKKDRYIEAMINRVWKDANVKANFNPSLDEKRSPEKFAPAINELLEYKSKYTPVLLEHIDRFYKSVYGHGMNEHPEVSEEAESENETMPEDISEDELQDIPEGEAEDMKLNE